MHGDRTLRAIIRGALLEEHARNGVHLSEEKTAHIANAIFKALKSAQALFVNTRTPRSKDADD